MLSDIIGADRVYIACGYINLRRGTNGLAALVQQQFHLDPYKYNLTAEKGKGCGSVIIENLLFTAYF